MLTPEDIKKQTTFSKGFRGYEVEEVDKFLATLIKEYEYLYLDNLEQKETIERVSSKLEYYQQMEQTMQSTLTVAQETADEVKAASEKKAALLEQETQVKCDQQLADAKAAAQKLHEEAMSAAESLYNQTKVKTDNMLQAAMAESNTVRDEAKTYADTLRRKTDMEIEKLRVVADDSTKKRLNSATAEANKILEDARKEANQLMLDANTKYRKLVGDTEERCRKLVFDAEARAYKAQSEYDSIKQKSAQHRKSMAQLLESQLEILNNFGKNDEQ